MGHAHVPSGGGRTGRPRALTALNTVLTTVDLARLNEQVDSWRRLPEDVARDPPGV